MTDRQQRRVATARWAVLPCTLAVVVAAVMVGATHAGATGGMPLIQQVSSDPLTVTPAQPAGIHHATEVETDTMSNGSTVVASFQVGRFNSFGGAATGWATSTDGGTTWHHGLLPGLTSASPSPNSAYIGVANQSVLWDAAHQKWLIPTVADVSCSLQIPQSSSCVGRGVTEHALMVNSSTDGLTWNLPVTAVASNVDKPWGVCDNSPVSPFYGTCYVAYAQIDDADRIALVHTTDGGQTWSAPVTTPSGDFAYNAIPVVQPNGRLIVVATDPSLNGGNNSQLFSFVSNDGGATLSDSVMFSTIQYHTPAGGIRGKNKPSVAVDAAGTIYVAWADCRFRPGCAENDIVYATSTDGIHYLAPNRIPSQAASSTVDNFIPGFAVRPGTSGTSAEIGVVNYSYPSASCTNVTCQLNVEFSTSIDGGATWTTQQLNSTPMQVGWLAPTSLGPAVGDYESVSYVDGHAVTVFPLAQAPVSGVYNEAENAATFPWAGGSPITTTAGSGQVAAVGTDFGAPLEATVVDPVTGLPVSGASVTFTAPPSGAGGTFAGGATSFVTTTDSSGLATASTFTAGATAGDYTVTATTPGGTASYSLANAGAPTTLAIGAGTSPQGAPVNLPFATPLSATVEDANGTPVPDASVTFTAPPSGASGTFASTGTGTATVTANSFGMATAPAFSADSTTGAYSVTATSGAASGSYQLTNTSSAPSSIVIETGDSQSTLVGTPFVTPLSVQVLDNAGQPYPGTPVTFTAPTNRTSATFVSSGTATTQILTDASGVATVPTTYAAAGAGTYSVAVAAGTANTVISLTNNPGPATSITVVPLTNDQSGLVNQPFPSALKATVTDSLGNPIIGDLVTFTAPASGASGTFAGTGLASATVAASATGVATSPTFTANGTVGSYQVSAIAASTAVTQPTVNFSMTNTLAPSITSAAATTFTLGVSDTFTVTAIGSPVPALTESGSLPSGVGFVDNGNGTATLSGTPSSAGSYPILIGAANGQGSPAQQSFVLDVDPVPAVTGINPAAGPATGGSSVTITGSGFTGATAVTFGTTPATSFTVGSDTAITATAPPGSGSGDVTVTTPGGTSTTSSADSFTWVAAPVVTGVSPAAGPLTGGAQVTISGSGFTNAMGVSFGGSPATSFAVQSDGVITATAPAGTGSADIVVTTAGGSSATSSADMFSWVAAPIVTGISPASGPTIGGTPVTITGSGFTGATAVSFGGTPAASFTFVSDTDITATAPAGSGSGDVVVTAPGGMSATSPVDVFTWVVELAIAGISPSAGPQAGGTLVNITGSGFTGATGVSFDSTPATSFTVVSDSVITATAPAGSGSGDVVVATSGGSSPTTPADVFTWVPAPVVTGISPAIGPVTGGSPVAISGSGFTGATAVSFGGSPATSFTFVSDTDITATAPAGAGSGDVVVTTAGGPSATSSADIFTWVAAPVVTGISPAAGPAAGGTPVTITGTGFTGASGVSFGSTPATSFALVSDSVMTAVAPPGVGTGDVVVTAAGGPSATSSADVFTWIARPVVTGISPATGPLAGGTSVNVTGSGFTGASAVSFGGTPATAFTVVDGGRITATAPAGSGSGDVVVTAPGGTSATSTADVFTWLAAPVVTSISPSAGPTSGGTSVTIAGSGFTGATGVSFGSTPAASFTVMSDTDVKAVAPAGSGSGDVVVTAAGGTSAPSPTDVFSWVVAPAVTGVNPTSGPLSGGTSVTISGSGFTGATAVTFGGTPATSFAINSDTDITATAPAGSGPGDVVVTTSGGMSATSPVDVFTWVAPPAVTAVSPASGPLAGGTSVTISGSGFTGATAVTFGGTPATSFTINSDTDITATAPAGSGPGDVVVTAPGGVSAISAADVFTWTAGPIVTSISPTSGTYVGGTSVTISGSGFSLATAVRFGPTSAPSFHISSNSTMTAVSPPGTGVVDVTVASNGGVSATSAADHFTYISPPGAPTGLLAKAGWSSATLSWTVPASTGGSPITTYTVTSSPGLRHCASATTTCTISGLTNGTTYTFTVVAANAIGAGPASAVSNAVVPVVPPPPVQNWKNAPPIVGIASLPNGLGYWLVNAKGAVTTHGFAVNWGSMGGHPLNSPITHIVATPDGRGYWLVAGDGGTFAFGDAGFYGSMAGHPLNKPIVDIAPTPNGKGYWLVASDGGIFAFGNAQFYGSMGGSPLNQPIVGMSADSATNGYWLVASDGGIFAFGAPFFGSTGAQHLNQPVNGMTVTPGGGGYWFVASDGGIFAFGDAGFYGSAGGGTAAATVVGMATDDSTGGYWLADRLGNVYSFNAPYYGND